MIKFFQIFFLMPRFQYNQSCFLNQERICYLPLLYMEYPRKIVCYSSEYSFLLFVFFISFSISALNFCILLSKLAEIPKRLPAKIRNSDTIDMALVSMAPNGSIKKRHIKAIKEPTEKEIMAIMF